ncbi:MAG: class I SAM-dependent methyltransferase [Jatrophihabitans sp.]
MVTQVQARSWLDRWDRQQEETIPDREERFIVIGDVILAAIARPDPLVLDLGAGPGSLSVRLLDRLPAAQVVAVDADPLLLGLARAAYGDRPGLRVVDHDLRQDGWVGALQLDRAPDAIVSTTALHWLTRPQLAGVYASCGELLAGGGVFVDGDHLFDAPTRPRLHDVAHAVRAARIERVGLSGGEQWSAWWSAVGSAAELADLVGARGARPLEHTVPDAPGVDEHMALLSAAGFTEVGTVWQHGDDRVLVALR